MPTIRCDVDAARERIEGAGVAVEPGNTEYERWRASTSDATAVAYDDKVVVQGSEPAAMAALVRADAGGSAVAYFDATTTGSSGATAIGWAIVTDDGIVTEGGECVDAADSHTAEFVALQRAVDVAANHGFDELQVRGDAASVVAQVSGSAAVDDPGLRERRVDVRSSLRAFDEWSVEHVPRSVNERAHEQATAALEDRYA